MTVCVVYGCNMDSSIYRNRCAVKMPEVKMPEVKMSEIKLPEVKMSEPKW